MQLTPPNEILNMPILNQSSFPLLWEIFQYSIGGSIDKQKLYTKDIQNPTNLLEVGCSLGNITPAFLKFENISYTGIDIDPIVIEHAKQRFSNKNNVEFICDDLRDYAKQTLVKYDHILFAGICHHINDELLIDLLSSSSEILTQDGVLIIIDPLLPTAEDSWFMHKYAKHLEQGQFLRKHEKMLSLIDSIEKYDLIKSEVSFIGATPLSWPRCFRFGTYVLKVN
ncbi:MAG: SAM-dependent methyltransferase [Enterobacterales bacterium]|jgi:SAM-dependent methyltransferase